MNRYVMPDLVSVKVSDSFSIVHTDESIGGKKVSASAADTSI